MGIVGLYTAYIYTTPFVRTEIKIGKPIWLAYTPTTFTNGVAYKSKSLASTTGTIL